MNTPQTNFNINNIKSTFLRNIFGLQNQHLPIWLMRQAGRYLPEYLAIRNKAGSFMNLCTNVDLATEVTLMPINRFNLDAAILFSDILVVPDAMGLGLSFVENEGPRFAKTINTISDLNTLQTDNIMDRLQYVPNIIKNLKTKLPTNIPLIGFSGSPFTLACYMIEGASSKNHSKIKAIMYNNSDFMHQLLTIITNSIITYLNAQIEAGCDTVMIFDSWGGILTDRDFLEFSLPYITQICKSIHNSYNGIPIPKISFTRGLNHMIGNIASTKVIDVIGVDWTCNLSYARELTESHTTTNSNKITLQGNLDPVLLLVGDKPALKKQVERILHDYYISNNESLNNLIFNLGHGVLPHTNPDHVAYLVDIVHDISMNFKM